MAEQPDDRRERLVKVRDRLAGRIDATEDDRVLAGLSAEYRKGAGRARNDDGGGGVDC